MDLTGALPVEALIDAVQLDEKRKQMRERTMADVRTRPEKILLLPRSLTLQRS